MSCSASRSVHNIVPGWRVEEVSELQRNDGDLFGRVVTAMATPFNENDEIDYGSLEKLVNHLIENRTETILVSGTTGESPTLTSQEKMELLKKTIEFAGGRAKVIFGSGSNNTRASVETSIAAEAAGAQGLLVVAPYYNKPSQAGIFAHVQAVSNAVSVPIIVYNIPGRCGVNIEPETMIRLARECSQVKAIKDSAGNVDQTAELAARLSAGGEAPDFRIYCGDDYLTLPMLSVGACGVVSVASHVVGSEIGAMVDAFFAGDFDKARTIHYKYLPVFKGLFAAPNPTCLKYFLSRMGLISSRLRLPLVPLDAKQKSQMDALLESANLLTPSSI